MQHDHDATRDSSVAAIHSSLMHMRRYLSRPPSACLPPLPGLPDNVDVTHAWACETIRLLAAAGSAASVKQVANELMLDHSTASRLLTQLADRGLVTRERDPADRRSTVVTLTESGQRVAVTAEAIRTHLMAWVFAEWDDQELAGFAQSLGRFSNTIGGYLSELINGGMPQVLDEALRHAASELGVADTAGQPGPRKSLPHG